MALTSDAIVYVIDVEERMVPIIFITGHGNVPMSVRAMKSGALDFLQKPFNDQGILEVIRCAVGRGRLMRKMAADSVADLVRMAQRLQLSSAYQTKGP